MLEEVTSLEAGCAVSQTSSASYSLSSCFLCGHENVISRLPVPASMLSLPVAMMDSVMMDSISLEA